jgi:hypothetical protein
MKKSIWALGTALVVSSAFGIAQASASKPFLTFCFKHFPPGSNAQPDLFALPSPAGTCAGGYHASNEASPAQLITDTNALSKAMFQNGFALGNYQTSIRDQSSPCLAGQLGCNP